LRQVIEGYVYLFKMDEIAEVVMKCYREFEENLKSE